MSKELTRELGKGFSRSNLQNMRLLYLNYPICQSLSGKLSFTHYCELFEQEEKLIALEKKFKQEDEEIQKRKKELYSGLEKRTTNLNQAISEKVGRNETCPCGIGKKYKKCCG